MSIDEVCKYIEDFVLYDMSERIIDLLRAGQLMRQSFDAIDEDDGTSWASNIKKGELSVAGQAWDKALGKTEEE